MENLIKKAGVLMEALPYIQKFTDKVVVVKYGGNAMLNEQLKNDFARNIVMMKCIGLKPVVVHGGGPQIDNLMKRLGIPIKFAAGVRCTPPEAMEVVEMVLTGSINKEIVSLINHHGGKAIGLSGKDGDLIVAEKIKVDESLFMKEAKGVDVGQVGQVVNINPRVIEILDSDKFIPVIAPVGAGLDRTTYNINADDVAGAIAAKLRAEKLVLLTDIEGVMDKKGKILSSLSEEKVRVMIEDGTISGGMIPKIKSCLIALDGGVNKAHIIDGRVPNALLLEIFTDKGIGTEIVRTN